MSDNDKTRRHIYKRKLGRDDKYDSIIQHEVTSYSSNDLLDAPVSSVMDDINRAERLAREILKKAGLPVDLSVVVNMPDGSQCSVLALVKNNKLEPEWYAANILHYSRCARRHIESGDASNAVWVAMRLQQSLDHLEFRKWEYPARVGLKHLKGTKASKYTEADKKAWGLRAKELWQDTAYHHAGKPSVHKVAKKIAEEVGAGSKSIRNYLYSIKN